MLDSLRHKEKDDHKRESMCFSLVFPIQAKKVDGTLIKIISKEELKMLIKREDQINHRRKSKIELVFPVEAKLADGNNKILNSEDELKWLIRTCKDD